MNVFTPAKIARNALPLALTISLAALAVTSAYAAEPTTNVQAAANSIQRIDYAIQPGGKIVLKISMKEPLQAVPAGFTINNPPRIALDIPNTTNAYGKNLLSVNEGVLRNMNIVEAGNRTRLVLNLAKPAGYDTRIEGNNLLVTLQPSEIASASSNITTRFAQATDASQKHAIRDIDFRRGKNGEGKIIVDLSDTNTGIDIRKQGKTLVIDFASVSLPGNLERRLDVTDFGTPVQSVDTFSQGKNARIVIEPKGDWEHSAYQTDRQFILEIKQIVEDPSKLANGSKPKYKGEKLSLNFQNVEIRSVLQVIADFTGLNIITSDSVSGNLTLRLKDVPWDQALDIILQSKGLAKRENGSVILIAPSDELATKEKLELEAKQQISELEQTQTESFQLKFQKAPILQKMLTDEKNKLLTKRGTAMLDERTNTVFVHDTPSKLDEIRRLVNQIDVPIRQVLIESRIVEVSDAFNKKLGARLGFIDAETRPQGQNTSGYNANIGGRMEATTYLTGQYSAIPTLQKDGLISNLAAGTVGGFQPGSLALSIFRGTALGFLNLEISALQADGKGKLLSNPRVVTSDQTEASIESGTEIPYLTASSSGATTVQFKKAVLSLKVKPQITPDDNVIMDIKVNKDSPDYEHITAGVPPLLTKQITTQVLVENGGTVVIGGIYTSIDNETITKVPLFGDIPVVGHLFKNRVAQNEKTELLIFVTPKILKDTLNVR